MANAAASRRRRTLRIPSRLGRSRADPRDPNRAFAAALGHAFGPNAERGVFRTTDGGAHWQKVLFKDNDTGRELVGDPRPPARIRTCL